MSKVYTGYHGTSETGHGLCVCRVDNPLAKARGYSLRTGAQTMLYISHVLNKVYWFTKSCFFFHNFLLIGKTIFVTFFSAFSTLLHSERPKLYGVLAILSAIGLTVRAFSKCGQSRTAKHERKSFP